MQRCNLRVQEFERTLLLVYSQLYIEGIGRHTFGFQSCFFTRTETMMEMDPSRLCKAEHTYSVTFY